MTSSALLRCVFRAFLILHDTPLYSGLIAKLSLTLDVIGLSIITYQLKDRSTWGMLDLFFVLAYPVALFCVAKMLLPTNTHEEGRDMRAFFHSQFRMVSILMLFCIGFSILFNFHYLQVSVLDQLPLFLFFLTMLLMALRPVRSDRVHQLLAIAILLASGAAVLLTREVWVIG